VSRWPGSSAFRILAGFASTSVGLHDTAVVYGLGVVVLSLAALAAQAMLAARRPTGSLSASS